MVRHVRSWLVAAVIFTLVNAAGAGFAAAEGGGLHAGAHVALMLLGTYLTWRLALRLPRREVPTASLADGRLEQLQQSVDVVAIEVERIGEAQRFNAKQQAEREEQRR